MLNLQTLTAKTREVRGNVVNAVSARQPHHAADLRPRRTAQIARAYPADATGLGATLVGYFRCHRLAHQRRLQPALLLRELETGQCTIVVAKQTTTAERGRPARIEIVRKQRKDAARIAGDHPAYMQWDSATCDELAASMTDAEQAIVFDLVSRAEVKHDTVLPPGVIKRLRDRQA